MQPPQPPRGMYPGGVPPQLSRSGTQSPLGQPMGPPPMAPNMPGMPGMTGLQAVVPPPHMTPPPAPGEVRSNIIVRRQPVIRYFRRARVGQVHSMQVRIEAEGAVGSRSGSEITGTEPMVTIQPIIPGAIITPASADVLLQPGSEANFSVLAFGSGKLRGAHVNLTRQGRKLTTIDLPMRANRGRLVRFMVILTILGFLLIKYPWHVHWEYTIEKMMPNPIKEQSPANAASKPTTNGTAPKLDKDAPTPNVNPPKTTDAPLSLQKQVMTFEHEEAIRQYIDVHAAKLGYGEKASKEPKPMPEWGSFDFMIAGAYYIKPGLVWSYTGLQTIRATPLGDMYFLGIMAGLTLIAAVLTRPVQRRFPGPMLEVRT